MYRDEFQESSVIRTRGWRSQPEYDNFISNLDISSLRFLNNLYAKELRDFRNENDLYLSDNQQYYKEMQQRKNMINEEIAHRMMDINASDSYINKNEDIFNPENGLVFDRDGNCLYGVYYSEDYDDIICESTDNTLSYINDDDEEEESVTPISKEELYRDWKYY